MKPFKIIDLHLSYQLFQKYQNINEKQISCFYNKKTAFQQKHILVSEGKVNCKSNT